MKPNENVGKNVIRNSWKRKFIFLEFMLIVTIFYKANALIKLFNLFNALNSHANKIKIWKCEKWDLATKFPLINKF